MDAMKKLSRMQDFYLLSFSSMAGIFKRPFYLRDLVAQMDYAGTGSFFIVFFVSLFIGMVLALQTSANLAPLGLKIYTGKAIGISVLREIGPVSVAGYRHRAPAADLEPLSQSAGRVALPRLSGSAQRARLRRAGRRAASRHRWRGDHLARPLQHPCGRQRHRSRAAQRGGPSAGDHRQPHGHPTPTRSGRGWVTDEGDEGESLRSGG